jgi:hypothetical protein
MTQLVETGKVRPVIDRCYPLSEVPDAIRYLETIYARASCHHDLSRADRLPALLGAA